MTLLEAKDKAAQEFGYEHFMDATQSVEDDLEYDDIICLAMTIYAESKAKEAVKEVLDAQSNVEIKYKNILEKEAFNEIWNAAIDAAAGLSDVTFDEGGRMWVNSLSILNLKK